MPRMGTMLTDRAVKAALKKNKKLRLYDGQGKGLRLDTTGTGHGSWIFRAHHKGPDYRPEVGLGSVRDVSLAEARGLTDQCRAWLREGKEPKIELDRVRTIPSVPTVREVALMVLEVRKSKWKNPKKTVRDWNTRFENYVPSTVKELPVTEFTRKHVLRILKPIWKNQNPTAVRVKVDLSLIFDWAIEEGLRIDNPARAKMATALETPEEGSNRLSLHYTEVAAAFQSIHQSRAMEISKLYAKLLFLSVLRSSEVRFARYSEFNFADKVWTIPRERMKSKRPHAIPLTSRMIHVLDESRKFVGDDPDIVFSGRGAAGFLGANTLAALLQAHKLGMTPHGIRSSFRDWCAETERDHIQAEICLHHQVGDATMRAYFRTNLVEQRRRIMSDWGDVVHGKSA
ncbi:MAG: integrase arm-type DNA-binding domain-containing protein [Immundisolibacterales bacterium]|nr:integrase arm-type DNA-binding domain-containing protein [Immundisolibacterales bacterium]